MVTFRGIESRGANPTSERDSVKKKNGHRGPTTIDFLGSGYSADIFFRGSYIAEETELAQKTETLIVKANLWTPEVANQMVKIGLSGRDSQRTSWIGFRRLDVPTGEYVGLAWQEEVNVRSARGDRRLLYMKLRAFEPEAQGKHLGRIAMQLALGVHTDVEYIAHRTGNPLSVRSWLESGVFNHGLRFPYDQPFARDIELTNLLLWVYDRFNTGGKMPNLSTGVSIGDYLEPNGAIPDQIHGSAKDTLEWMTGRLRMNLARGDALYEIGKLK